ncbi:MAG: hypothetical protein E7A18_20775 [Enterocloster bolteae]|jgi:hypothetical protein|nr:hypothetical protein [Enterocloster bolteae]MDU1140176.1 hypothetical protein [Enterocloster bolteae]
MAAMRSRSPPKRNPITASKKQKAGIMGTVERFTGIDKRHQKKNGMSAAFLIFRCRISYSAKAARHSRERLW